MTTLVFVGGLTALHGQVTQTNIFTGVNLSIPDANPAGVQDIRNVVSDITQITSVKVRLKVTGDFNGDLYGYLRHNDGVATHISVLINRPGRTTTNQLDTLGSHGYADNGFDVTFDDSAANDIHTYRDVTGQLPAGDPLSGIWQPDARFVDPANVTTNSPRTVFLSEFEGLSASGEWTLFLADVDGGATNFLNSWGLEFTGKAMPSIVWTNPATITYGTALGPDQLNATSDIPGTFAYNPPTSTVLAASNNQTLSVTFLPDDTNAYVVASASVTLNVLPQALTISANSTNKTYGNTQMLAGTEFTTVGLVNGDSVTNVSLTSAGAVATAPTGSYDITPGAASGTGLANYTIEYVAGTLSVEAAPLLVQANDVSRAYGQTNPPFTATFSGWVNAESLTNSDVAGTPLLGTLADTNSPVGKYEITNSLGGLTSTNYTFSFTNGTLTVTADVLTLDVASVVRPYGQTNPPLTGTLTGLQNGDVISITFAVAADTNSPVGVYPITPTWVDPGGKLANYTVLTNDGALTVEAAPLLVRADDASRAYGQTNPPFTATFSGWVNGEDTNVLAGELVFTTTADTNSPVGTYAIKPGGLSAANYSLTFSNGTLTVTADVLTLDVASFVRPYGQTNSPLTGTLSGFQNRDVISVTFAVAADTNSPVGVYPITPTWDDPGDKLANYTVLTNSGALTVEAAPLLVQADDVSRAYGAPNPPFTATFSGWVNGEDTNVLAGELVFTMTADTNSPVGTYAIEPGGLSATNYSLTFSNGTLTVTADVLTLDVASFVRPYGQTNPPLTGTLTGLQNGDVIAVTFAVAADTNSPVGVYPITPTWNDPGDKLANYTVLTNNGSLTITKAVSVPVIGSSANPALLSSPVTFTVNLAALAPSSGVPTGTVQFIIDSEDYEAPVTLSDGEASLTTTTLTAGQHTVSMYYAGDDNFQEAGAVLNPSQVINTPPVAGADIIYRVPTQGTRTPVSALLANGSDADGDAVVFDSVNATSTAGGSLTATNGWVYYTPPTGFTEDDSFTYTISDGRGGIATGLVTVAVLTNQGTAARLTLLSLGNGLFRIISTGVPWGNYTIEFADGQPNQIWGVLATGTADSLGKFIIDDPEPPGTQARSYRAIYEGEGAASLPFGLALTSSANPALPGSSVTFTVNLNALASNSVTPSGSGQFYVDGAAYGEPVMVVSSSASLTTTTLSSGEHTVSVAYSGDGNFRSATCVLGQPQVINTPPVAEGDAIQRNPMDSGIKFRLSDLNYSDVDGDPLAFSMSARSTEGGTTRMADGWIFYTPPTGFVGADSFTYTMQDNFGATATATVQILSSVGVGGNPSVNLTVVDLGNGTYRIVFSGIPWRTYTVQYTENLEQPNWQSLAIMTADSQGLFEYDDPLPQGTPSRFYRSVSEFAGPTASPFRFAVWTNFIWQTNGRTMEMWSERTLPAGWPNTPPLLAWNTNCLLYGLEGFTGISQCNEFEGAPGQVPVTLLTRRHGYTRGHGMGDNGLHTSLAGERVWFCTADNTVVSMTVAAEWVRSEVVAGNSYDYTIVIFTEDVPETIRPVSVISPADMEIYYWNTPELPYLFLATEQFGHCAANVAPFIYPITKGGDSGSPDMIPSPDNKLIMYSGRATTGFNPQMQTDINALSVYEGLNPNNYQLRWYELSPWGP